MKSRKQIQAELAEKLQQYRAEKQKKLENAKTEAKQRANVSKPVVTPKAETRVALSASAANIKSNIVARSTEIKRADGSQKISDKPKPNAPARRHSVDSKQTQMINKSKPIDPKKFVHVPSRIDTGIKRRSLSAPEKSSVIDENQNATVVTSVAKSGLPASKVSALLQMMAGANNTAEISESAHVPKAVKERRKSHYLSDDKHERATGRLSTVLEEPTGDDSTQPQSTKQARLSTQTPSTDATNANLVKRKGSLSLSVPSKSSQPLSDNQRKRASSASDAADVKKPRLSSERGRSLQPVRAPVGLKPRLSLSTPVVSKKTVPAATSVPATKKVTNVVRLSSTVSSSAPVKRLLPKSVNASIVGPRMSQSCPPPLSSKSSAALPPIVSSVLKRQAEGPIPKRVLVETRKSLSAVDKKQDKPMARANPLASRKSIACTKDAVRSNLNRRSVSVPLPKSTVSVNSVTSASARKSVIPSKTAVTPAATPRQRSKSMSFTPKTASAIKTPSSLRGNGRGNEMRDKLNAWLESRGKTPGQFRHAGCFHVKASDLSTIEQPADVADESNASVSDFAINGIEKCQQLIKDQSLSEAGQWLDEVLQDHPQVTGSATYWVCRALIADAADAEAAFVIDIFEQAVRFDAKPAEVVSEALQAYLAKHRPAVAAFPVSATPSRRPRDVDEDNIMPSSAVKLRIMDSAQFFKKVRSTLDTPDRPEICVITPVRRSTRKSVLRPAESSSVQLVNNIVELSEQQRAKAIFLKNDALDGSFSELCAAE